MKITDLKPAGSFAQQYGVKMLGYGPPGAGKTPLVNTAPRPILIICEPGMLSMRGSNVPSIMADDPQKLDDVMDWVLRSKECQNFDTICVDSVSQLAETILKAQLKSNRDGRRAYGEMARTVLDYLTNLYYMRQKHVYLIGKQASVEEEGVQVKRPYFPGQELNVQVPHLYDIVAHIAKATIPGMQKPVLAIRTTATFGINARDRSGKLAELEPPNLTELFKKAMS